MTIPTFRLVVPKSIPDSLKSEYIKYITNKANYKGKHPVTAKIIEELIENGESNEEK